MSSVPCADTTGRFVQRRLERDGVVVHVASPVIRLEGDGRVQRVVLADGSSFDCDFAVAAVPFVITCSSVFDTIQAAPGSIAGAVMCAAR